MKLALPTHSFLKSERTLEVLYLLRRGANILSIELGGLSVDDRSYLETEDCIRNAIYSQVESRLQSGTTPWVRKLCLCYRDLFVNPQRALDVLDELEEVCPSHFDLPLRLKFWRAHLNLLLGQIETGRRTLTQIATKVPDGPWHSEMLAIRAMGYYFVGRTRDALRAHYDCQESLRKTPDIFIQTFDSGMATRTALKLCDPSSFEHFSQLLDESLRERDDSRYRLRHTGYRAMIFNQLGEHDVAEVHWKMADSQLHATESAIERGQYLVFRGMSYALVNDLPKARRTFELSKHELKLAGSPALYLAELDIAETLTPIANPSTRSLNLKKAADAAEKAKIHFLDISKSTVYPHQIMYAEAADFCDSILTGEGIAKASEGRQSLVLSVIENVSTSAQFAKGLSHFRLIPNFVHQMAEADLSESGIRTTIESVLQIRPELSEDKFCLPGAFSRLESQPEIKTILDVGSTLFSLGQKANELFEATSRLKEAARAKHLLHDVRFFAQELAKYASNSHTKLNLAKLSNDLNHLIESYLQAMKNGENPGRPTIVHFPTLLAQVVGTAFQITGKQTNIPAERTTPYLWISEPLLKRLLLNLIKNGAEAGSGNQPVTVSYKTELQAGTDRLVVYISDNGLGINHAIFQAIRDNSETFLPSSKTDGVGLGLRSAIECAKEMNADLEIVQNLKQTGTTFKLSVPMPAYQPHIETPEILVIDDSVAVADAWRAFGNHEQISVQVVYAEEAAAALNTVAAKVAWIVIDYDLKLPGCTGADLGSSLLTIGPKVALSTGFSKHELPEEVVKINWHAILRKEPQYPMETPRRIIVLPTKERLSTKTKGVDSELRHEIKNELTPLRVAFRALSTRSPDDPHVKLIACSIKGIERIVKKTEGTNDVKG
jgi:signal transduction histidine kinase